MMIIVLVMIVLCKEKQIIAERKEKMIVKIQLNDKLCPEECTIENAIKIEYRYNFPSETNLLYVTTNETFFAVGIEAIESIEIKEK